MKPNVVVSKRLLLSKKGRDTVRYTLFDSEKGRIRDKLSLRFREFVSTAYQNEADRDPDPLLNVVRRHVRKELKKRRVTSDDVQFTISNVVESLIHPA